MKKYYWMGLLCAGALGLSACANQQGGSVRTKQGAVGGAALGAAAGAIIGHQKGRGMEGALIGGGAGALGGAALGSAQDEKEGRQTNY